MTGSILILGNTWHGRWSLAIHEELQRLGYESHHLDVRYTKRIKIRKLDAMLRQSFFKKLSADVKEKIKLGADTCLVITPYDLPTWLWDDIKQQGVRLIGWWGDDPMVKGNLGESLAKFDAIHLIDKAWINRVACFNPNTFYLPHAASPATFFPIPDAQHQYDISFVGDSFDGKMPGLYRARLLEVLHENHLKPVLFGDDGWLKKYLAYPFVKAIYKGPIRSMQALNDLYNASKIVLNIHHNQVITDTNQRTTEATAAGAFVLADHMPVIEQTYKGHVATFNTPHELVEKATFFLANDSERQSHVNAARDITLTEHTYAKRIERLLIP